MSADDGYEEDPSTSVRGVNFYRKGVLLDDGSGGKYLEALAKVENTNSCEVDVEFSMAFVCSDGTTERTSPTATTIGPRRTQTGEGAGFWWRPCQGKGTRVRAGFTNVSVTVNPNKCAPIGGFY